LERAEAEERRLHEEKNRKRKAQEEKLRQQELRNKVITFLLDLRPTLTAYKMYTSDSQLLTVWLSADLPNKGLPVASVQYSSIFK